MRLGLPLIVVRVPKKSSGPAMSRWYDVHYAYREIVLAPCREEKERVMLSYMLMGDCNCDTLCMHKDDGDDRFCG